MQYYNSPKIKFSMTAEAQAAISAFFELQQVSKPEFTEKYTLHGETNTKFFFKVAAFIGYDLAAFSGASQEQESELLDTLQNFDFEIQETFYEYHMQMCNDAPVEAGTILLYLTLRQTLPHLMPALSQEVSEKLNMIIAGSGQNIKQKAAMTQALPDDANKVIIKIINGISDSLTELLS